MPTIPAIPEITGGAGSGNFNNEKITPTNAPVAKDNSISAIKTPQLVILLMLAFRYQIKSSLQWHFLAIG